MNNKITNYFCLGVSGTLIILATSFLQPAIAAQLKVDQLLFFGDSISDPGNIFNLTGGVIPPEAYDNGRFSNGDVWTEYFAEDLGLNPTPVTVLTPGSSFPFPGNAIPGDGINFTFGGAKTGSDHVSGNPLLPGLSQQIDSFSILDLNSLSANALGVVMAGSNDYIGLLSGGDPNTVVTTSVTNLSNTVATLANAGISHIMVANLPDLGKIPLGLSLGSSVSQDLTTLINLHNSSLATSLDQLSLLFPNTNFIELDLYGLVNDFIDNPIAFGFTEVEESCTNLDPALFPNTPDPLIICSPNLAEQNQYLFWDNQHTTTAAHRFIANEALNHLKVSEPSLVTALSVLAVSFVGKSLQKR